MGTQLRHWVPARATGRGSLPAQAWGPPHPQGCLWGSCHLAGEQEIGTVSVPNTFPIKEMEQLADSLEVNLIQLLFSWVPQWSS